MLKFNFLYPSAIIYILLFILQKILCKTCICNKEEYCWQFNWIIKQTSKTVNWMIGHSGWYIEVYADDNIKFSSWFHGSKNSLTRFSRTNFLIIIVRVRNYLSLLSLHLKYHFHLKRPLSLHSKCLNKNTNRKKFKSNLW